MKFYKNGKNLVSFLLFLLFCLKASCLNSKFESTQILEKKDHEIQIFELSKITPKNFRFFSNSKFLEKARLRFGDRAQEEINNQDIFEFFKKVLITYLQFFILFCILSFYKFFEELNQIKLLHISGKYSEVKDLTSENYKNKIPELNGETVFISGDTKILNGATDEHLQLSIEKPYAMIYRQVEVFNISTKTWVALIEENSEHNYFNEENLHLNLLNEYFYELNFTGRIFKFPRLFCKSFTGQVELNGILLSPQQLKHLEKYDIIKFPLIDFESNIFSEFDRRNPDKVIWESNLDYIYVFPCEKENSKRSECKLRISLRGYTGKSVTILAKLFNNTFKTYNTPYVIGEEDAQNQTADINLSSNMVYQSNIEYDLCNFLFCFCLSGPPSYYEKDDKNIPVNQYMATKTNWITEKKMTLSEFIFHKFDISTLRNNIVRLIFFYSLIIFFMISEEPLYIIFKFISTYGRQEITDEFIKFNLIASLILMLLVYSISKISFKFRHCISMCSVIFLIIILIILIIKELLIVI